MNAIIVHGGKNYCNYIDDCVEQFFLFNKNSKLFCIADQNFSELQILSQKFSNFQVILSSSLKKSAAHRFYLAFNRSAYNTWRGGFWRFVVERFFLIEEFMQQTAEKNLLHFEYDNLIFENINNFEAIFSKQNKILLPADGDKRCIAGVIFIPTYKHLNSFCKFYNKHCTIRIKNDMFAFSDFIDKMPFICGTLPVVPSTYTNGKIEFVSKKGEIHKKIERFSNNFKDFGVIFDAAAYGQFIGGIDGRNTSENADLSDQNGETEKNETCGFVNPDAAYNVEDFSFEWKCENGLKIPFLNYKGESYKIFNLHIHSKKLNLYKSNREN